MQAANSYAGPTLIRGALVQAQHADALGNPSQAVDVWDGGLELFHSIDNAINVNTFGEVVLINTQWNNAITLQGGRLVTHANAGGDVMIDGPIDLIGGGWFRTEQQTRIGSSISGDAALFLHADRKALHLDAPIASRGPIHVLGNHTTFFHQANAFVNDIEVRGGNLSLMSDNWFRSLRILDGGSLTIAAGNTLQLNDSELTVQSGSLDVQGQLAQLSHIRKIGLDHFTIDGVGVHQDAGLIVESGWLEAGHTSALGPGSGQIHIVERDTANFALRGSTTVERDVYLHNARGAAMYGALRQVDAGTADLTGDVYLGDQGAFIAAHDLFNLQGAIHGGSLHMRSRNQAFTLRLLGDGHTYTGDTNLWHGILELNDGGRVIHTPAIHVHGGGTLRLDNQTDPLTDRIDDAIAVHLHGGELNVRGGTEAIGLLSIGFGQATVRPEDSSLTLGEITRPGKGTVRFAELASNGDGTGTVLISNPQTLSEGMIGAWAVVGPDGSDIGRRFAGYHPTDGVVPISLFNKDLNAAAANEHVHLDAIPQFVMTSDRTIHSLLIEDDSGDSNTETIDLNGHRLTINSGGLLANDGLNQYLTNGQVAAGNGELIVHRSSTRPLYIEADLVDGADGAMNFVKTGRGSVVLSGNNTYTGDTTVVEGSLSITSLDALANSGNLFVSAGSLSIGLTNEPLVALNQALITNQGMLVIHPNDPLKTEFTFNQIEIHRGELAGKAVGTGTIIKNTPGLGQIFGNYEGFAGQIIINDGILETHSDSGSYQLGQATVKIMPDGHLRPLGREAGNATVELHGGTLMAGTFQGDLKVLADSTIALVDYAEHGNIGKSYTYNGAISGVADLRIIGPNDTVFNVNGSQTAFLGDVHAEGGALRGVSDYAFGLGTVHVYQSASMEFWNSQSFNRIEMAGGTLALTSLFSGAAVNVDGHLSFLDNTRIEVGGDYTATLGGTTVFHDGVMVTREGRGGLLDFAGEVLVDGEATLVAAEGRIRLSGVISPLRSGSSLHVLGGVAIDLDADIVAEADTSFSVTVDTAPAVIVANRPGQTISGNGQIGSATSISDGAGVSPGASAGQLTFTDNLTWGKDGEYVWEMADPNGPAGAADGTDLLTVEGVLEITATSDNPFIIRLVPLAAGGQPGQPTGRNAAPGQWLVLSADVLAGYSGDNVIIDASAWADILQEDESFQLHAVSNALYVQMVPEPISGAVLLAALTLLLPRRQT